VEARARAGRRHAHAPGPARPPRSSCETRTHARAEGGREREKWLDWGAAAKNPREKIPRGGEGGRREAGAHREREWEAAVVDRGDSGGGIGWIRVGNSRTGGGRREWVGWRRGGKKQRACGAGLRSGGGWGLLAWLLGAAGGTTGRDMDRPVVRPMFLSVLRCAGPLVTSGISSTCVSVAFLDFLSIEHVCFTDS
jgi:hypothetical protein